MTDCCDNILNLGCIASCDNIQTGITAADTGNYILEVNKAQILQAAFTVGDEIVFAGGYVNEDGITVFKIINPDGDYVTSGIYDCFQIEVTPTAVTQIDSDTDCGDCDVSVYLDSILQDTAAINCGATETINVVWL